MSLACLCFGEPCCVAATRAIAAHVAATRVVAICTTAPLAQYQTRELLQQYMVREAEQEEALKRDPTLQWQEDEVNTDDEEDPDGDFDKWKVSRH